MKTALVPPLKALGTCSEASAVPPLPSPEMLPVTVDAALTSTFMLSRRELEIVRHLAGAASVKEMSRRMQISPNTVKDYLKSIYRKTHVHSARELMVRIADAVPPPECARSEEVVAVLDAMLDASGPQEALQIWPDMVVGATQARRATVWRLRLTPQGKLFTPGWSDDPAHIVPEIEFINSLWEHGWVHRAERELYLEEERLAWDHLELRTEMAGIRTYLEGEYYALLASDPQTGAFSSLDLALIRTLARLIAPTQGTLLVRAQAS